VIGIEPAPIKSYQEYFVTTNPWLVGHPFRRGVVAVGEQILKDRELVRTEFYNDFLRPQDWFYCCGVLTAKDQSTASEITSIRSRRAGSFTSHEVALFEYLAPHLQCAVRIHKSHRGTRVRSERRDRGSRPSSDRYSRGQVRCESDSHQPRRRRDPPARGWSDVSGRLAGRQPSGDRKIAKRNCGRLYAAGLGDSETRNAVTGSPPFGIKALRGSCVPHCRRKVP
jgi:hypothetical protein